MRGEAAHFLCLRLLWKEFFYSVNVKLRGADRRPSRMMGWAWRCQRTMRWFSSFLVEKKKGKNLDKPTDQ